MIMYNSRLVIFLLFLTSIVTAQEPIERPPLNPTGVSNWEYDGFSYPDFGTGEQHSYFSLMYKMNPNLYTELQGFYDTYRTSNIFDISLRVRWYPAKKVYLFSGIGVQIQQSKVGEDIPVMPLRMINGVGYEPNKNISIEAVHDLNFSKNNSGLNASSNPFTLKGKYRF